MTRKQMGVLIVVAAVLVAGLVGLHLALPIAASWPVNRALHHAWQAAVGLGLVAGGVWIMWPRPAAPRRDEERQRARRRVIGLVAAVLAGAALAVFSEVHRELATRRMLGGLATEDLRAIAAAMAAYGADHDGAPPSTLADLAPKYLEAGRLTWAYRRGPVPMEPPAPAPDGPHEEPSYALVKEPVAPDPAKRRPSPHLAYLRPGSVWAPLTVVLEKDGAVRIVGEDEVQMFEDQSKKR